jgi:hypothetical protein
MWGLEGEEKGWFKGAARGLCIFGSTSGLGMLLLLEERV